MSCSTGKVKKATKREKKFAKEYRCTFDSVFSGLSGESKLRIHTTAGKDFTLHHEASNICSGCLEYAEKKLNSLGNSVQYVPHLINDEKLNDKELFELCAALDKLLNRSACEDSKTMAAEVLKKYLILKCFLYHIRSL